MSQIFELWGLHQQLLSRMNITEATYVQISHNTISEFIHLSVRVLESQSGLTISVVIGKRYLEDFHVLAFWKQNGACCLRNIVYVAGAVFCFIIVYHNSIIEDVGAVGWCTYFRIF
jgi:hypothetical protein